MFELKPDFEAVLNRYEAWWHCEIVDRPLISIVVPKPGAARSAVAPKQHASHRERWMDTEYQVACAAAELESCVYVGDSLPVVWPNLGPEVFSAFYGCEMEYGQDTAWSRPFLADYSRQSLDRLGLDRNCFISAKSWK